jgi:hypothetical protein
MSSKRSTHTWLPSRIDPFHVATAAVLVQLNNFAFLVRHQTFQDVAKGILSRDAMMGTTVQLVAGMSAVLRKGRGDTHCDVLEKSLQETLFSIGHCDFNHMAFGRNVQAFVRESGCKGLIQLFLELHLSNVIWKELQNSSRMPHDIQTLENLPNGIDRLCRQAVKTTTASWRKWPELDVPSARQILRSLRSEMVDVLAAPPSLRKSA